MTDAQARQGRVAVVIGALAVAVLAAGVTVVATDGAVREPAPAAAPQPTPQPTPERTPSRAEEEAAVRDAFETYRTAALARDGDRALTVISARAYDFYDRMRDLALTASLEELGGLPALEQITVYTVRAEVDPGLLRTASPAEVLAAGVDAGLVSDESIRNLTLGDVTVYGDSAGGQALRKGEPLPFEFSFVKEEGSWRLDLLPLISIGVAAFAGLAEQQGVSVQELIDRLVEVEYGPAKAAEVKKPLGP